MTDDSVTDVLSLLNRRERILCALLEGTQSKSRPQSKPELVESLDLSRSTVDRSIAELSSEGLVERLDGRYRLTLFGEVVYRTYGRLRETLGEILRIRDPISALPADAGIDDIVFDGASVEFTPNFGPALVEATFRDADRARIASPLVAIVYGSAVQESTSPVEATVEMLLDPDAIGHLRKYYRDVLPALAGRPDVTIREVGTGIPFCLALLGNESRKWMSVMFPIGDDTAAVLTNDSAEAVEWAGTMYEEYRSHSREIGTSAG